MAHLIYVSTPRGRLGYRLPGATFSSNWCTMLPSSGWPLLTRLVRTRRHREEKVDDKSRPAKWAFQHPSFMFEPKSISLNLKPLARRFFDRLSAPERKEASYPRSEIRVCKNSSFKNGWRTKWQMLALKVWDKWISPGAPKIVRRKSRRSRNRKLIEARFKLPLK